MRQREKYRYREKERDRERDRSSSLSKSRRRSRSDSESRKKERKEREHREYYRDYHRDSEKGGDYYERERSQDYYAYQKQKRGSRRSRSRSNQNKRLPNDDFYEERKQEEKEQSIRLAIRSNTLNYDTTLYEAYMSLPEIKREQLAQQAQSPERIHECILVRELYVSGLFDSSEMYIKQFFSKYGDVEDVEIIKNFIFVKYFKVEDASNACADYHNINTTLHQSVNVNFKIFFADHLKRFNVVSNNISQENRDYLIPVLYASIKNDPQFTNEQYLLSIFSKYGFIRNIDIKKNELPTQRTYALVEYETMTQTLRAREKLKYQRDKLGDRKSEITILIDNEKITRLYPNINNQLRYQRKRQMNISGQMGGNAPMTNIGMPMGISHSNQSTAYNHYSQPINNPQPNQSNQPSHQTEDIFAMLKEFADKEEPQEEHMESDWFGFFTRNKQYKVEVDFYRIHKEPFELESILNVSHRADLQEGLNRSDYILAGKFKAANQANAEAFLQYINYFKKKERGGIIFTKNYLIYLVPSLPELNIPYPVENNELLALFFKI